jgi:hypothetical protein
MTEGDTMKRLSLSLSLSMMCALLAGCAMFRPAAQAPQPAQVQPGPQGNNGGAANIELVPFRPGVSSATVENMAKASGCTGGRGAGLLTEPGPIEVYRMVCDNGKVFQARCEMRQCKAM